MSSRQKEIEFQLSRQGTSAPTYQGPMMHWTEAVVMYEDRIAALEAELAEARGTIAVNQEEINAVRNGCPASILAELCDMRRALGLEIIRTSYTEILPAILALIADRDALLERCEALDALVPYLSHGVHCLWPNAPHQNRR